MWLLPVTILAVVFLFVLSGLRVVQQYERGVIFVFRKTNRGKRTRLILDRALHFAHGES